MFKIRYIPSRSHWLFPPIIMGILVVLLAAIALQRCLRCRKTGEAFIPWRGTRFFEDHWDRVRFVGTLVLFVLYILAMNLIGFLGASIIFVFLFNVLYAGIGQLREIPAELRGGAGFSGRAVRSVLISLTTSVLFSVAIWYLFGRVFNITLP